MESDQQPPESENTSAEKVLTPEEKKAQQIEEARAAFQKIKPWEGKATRLDKALMWSICGVLAFLFAMLPLKPFLLGSNPILLEFLTGSKAAVGAGAAFARVGEVPLAVVIGVGVIGMIKFRWLFWWAGRQWGRGMVNLFAQTERSQRFAERIRSMNPWWIRLAVVFTFLPGIPSALVHALAGWAGMRLLTFVLLDALGSLIVTCLIAGLGYSLGQYAVDAVMAVDKYAIWISLALALVVAFIAQREAGRRVKSSS